MSKTKHKSAYIAVRQHKKAQFQDSESRSSGLRGPLIALAAVTLVGIVVMFFVFRGGGATAGETPQPLNAAGQDLRIPVSEVSSGVARFYSYPRSDGRQISFFVLRSSDGVIRAAFDACDVCFKSRKGYRQEGDDMVCRNCGRHFPSASVNEIQGGCNPAPLGRTIEGDQLVIRLNDLLQGQYYF